jgi:hypothetical protein
MVAGEGVEEERGPLSTWRRARSDPPEAPPLQPLAGVRPGAKHRPSNHGEAPRRGEVADHHQPGAAAPRSAGPREGSPPRKSRSPSGAEAAGQAGHAASVRGGAAKSPSSRAAHPTRTARPSTGGLAPWEVLRRDLPERGPMRPRSLHRDAPHDRDGESASAPGRPRSWRGSATTPELLDTRSMRRIHCRRLTMLVMTAAGVRDCNWASSSIGPALARLSSFCWG